MSKKIFILIFMAIFLIACQQGKEEAKNFTADYTTLRAKLVEQRAAVKSRDEYNAYKNEKKQGFEDLLKKYEKAPAIDDIEILRASVLLALKKTDDAEKKIDAILAKNPKLLAEAKMVKVRILLEREKYGDAYLIFKEIEPQITDIQDLYEAYYRLGTEHKDKAVLKEYAQKFLASKQIPKNYIKSKMSMYFVLSGIAKQEGKLDEAKKVLEDGVAAMSGERDKKMLQSSRDQLDLYGKPSTPVSAPNWLNSSRIRWNRLKGKVVLVSFWATWCPSCRELTPTLVRLYDQYKDDENFALIGFTRLYGKYRDDEIDLGKVSKEEELENIKKYLARKKMEYPIGIAEDKSVFKDYKISGIPTLLFIDKQGNLDFTKIGAGDEEFINQKIQKLLKDI